MVAVRAATMQVEPRNPRRLVEQRREDRDQLHLQSSRTVAKAMSLQHKEERRKMSVQSNFAGLSGLYEPFIKHSYIVRLETPTSASAWMAKAAARNIFCKRLCIKRLDTKHRRRFFYISSSLWICGQRKRCPHHRCNRNKQEKKGFA